jgi:hypothetical protein
LHKVAVETSHILEWHLIFIESITVLRYIKVEKVVGQASINKLKWVAFLVYIRIKVIVLAAWAVVTESALQRIECYHRTILSRVFLTWFQSHQIFWNHSIHCNNYRLRNYLFGIQWFEERKTFPHYRHPSSHPCLLVLAPHQNE